MAAAVEQILDLLWEIAPADLAEEWDNVGLLEGSRRQTVRKALVALDLSKAVIEEAHAIGAELIITHHPVYFKPARSLLEEDFESSLLRQLVRYDISLIAMHTNYDSACPGVNDALAQKLDLANVQKTPGGMMRSGDFAPVKLKAFAQFVGERLNTVVRAYGDPDTDIERAAVLGGSGGSLWEEALESKANVYITGEIGYHKALEAVAAGLSILECGHRETELPGVAALEDLLRKAIEREGLDVQVILSRTALC